MRTRGVLGGAFADGLKNHVRDEISCIATGAPVPLCRRNNQVEPALVIRKGRALIRDRQRWREEGQACNEGTKKKLQHGPSRTYISAVVVALRLVVVDVAVTIPDVPNLPRARGETNALGRDLGAIDTQELCAFAGKFQCFRGRHTLISTIDTNSQTAVPSKTYCMVCEGT